MNQNSTSSLSPSLLSALVPQLNIATARPVFDSQSERAARLKQLLLDLSKEEDNKDFRTILRDAASSIREKAFGYNRAVTKKRILKLLSEFELCEIADFTDELNLPEKEIRAALDDLLKAEKISEGKRRRWQEPGKHYNQTFELKK